MTENCVCGGRPHLKIVVSSRLDICREAELEEILVDFFASQFLSYKGLHFDLAIEDGFDLSTDLVVSLFSLLINDGLYSFDQFFEYELCKLSCNP